MNRSRISCRVHDLAASGPAVHLPLSLFTLNPRASDERVLLATG